MDSAIAGHVGLGCVKRAAEEAGVSKPASFVSPQSASAFAFLPWFPSMIDCELYVK